jgi:D-arabinose 1-dehydrogenase-like Zn-dependent alcohol dehydrogenase
MALPDQRFMRAAVVDAPRTASLQQTPLPNPGSGQVRVRLEGCGVCGSNLAVWQGQPWFTYPLPLGAPGHEGWGVIDAIGEGVVDLTPGTRVACLSSQAFAEYDIAAADAVVPLPASMDGVPFPGKRWLAP